MESGRAGDVRGAWSFDSTRRKTIQEKGRERERERKREGEREGYVHIYIYIYITYIYIHTYRSNVTELLFEDKLLFSVLHASIIRRSKADLAAMPTLLHGNCSATRQSHSLKSGRLAGLIHQCLINTSLPFFGFLPELAHRCSMLTGDMYALI